MMLQQWGMARVTQSPTTLLCPQSTLLISKPPQTTAPCSIYCASYEWIILDKCDAEMASLKKNLTVDLDTIRGQGTIQIIKLWVQISLQFLVVLITPHWYLFLDPHDILWMDMIYISYDNSDCLTHDQCKICQKIAQNTWHAWVLHKIYTLIA